MRLFALLTVTPWWCHAMRMAYLLFLLSYTNCQPPPQYPLFNSYAPNFFGSAPIDYVLSSYMTGGFKFQGPTPAPAPAHSGSGEGSGGSASGEGGVHDARGGKGGAPSLTPIWPAYFPAYAPQFAQAPPGTTSSLLAADANANGRGAQGKEQNGGGSSASGSGEKVRGKKDRRHRMLVINRNGKGVANRYWLG